MRTLRSRGTSGDAFSLIVSEADVCYTNRLHRPTCERPCDADPGVCMLAHTCMLQQHNCTCLPAGRPT